MVNAESRSYIAASDISAHEKKFVKLTDSKTVELCGANERAVGILEECNKLTYECKVNVDGFSLLQVGEACAIGKFLTSTAAGLGEIADAAGEYCRAIAQEAATAADDIIQVRLIDVVAHASDA